MELYFNSARGGPDYGVNDPDTADKYVLKSYILSSLDNAEIDALVAQVAAQGLIAICYGHGETSTEAITQLEYLIDTAISNGIRIMTRQQMVNNYFPR
jgi:L-asparaginase/Glu-tRNA(Gln) amidotransferase subunit D